MEMNILCLLSLTLVSFSTCILYTVYPGQRLSVSSNSTVIFREYKGQSYARCMVIYNMASSYCSVNAHYDSMTSTLTCELLNVYLYEVPSNLTSASGWFFIQEAPVYTDSHWAIVFRATAGIGQSVWDTWNADDRHDDAHEMQSCVLPSSSLPCTTHFRSYILDRWTNVKLVRLTLYKDGGARVARIIFNGQGTNRMSWLSPTGVLNSTWTDMVVPFQNNYFAIVGLPNVYRRFYLSRLHNGCAGDIGWVVVADVFPGSEIAGNSVFGQCTWELTRPNFPALLYIPGTTSAVWASAASADFMMVHVTFKV